MRKGIGTLDNQLKTKKRRRRNKILALKDDSRTWVSGEADLKVLVLNYFKNLYSEDRRDPIILSTISTFLAVDHSIMTGMSRIPTDEEIRVTIFSMGCFKASGVDGFLPFAIKATGVR